MGQRACPDGLNEVMTYVIDYGYGWAIKLFFPAFHGNGFFRFSIFPTFVLFSLHFLAILYAFLSGRIVIFFLFAVHFFPGQFNFSYSFLIFHEHFYCLGFKDFDP